MGEYSSAFISLFFWIIIVCLIIWALYKISQCFCPNILHLEMVPDDIALEPEPVIEVVPMENIAGQDIVIDGFVD